jgi:aminoglycoside/choline kinase family phosphotransferase
MARPNLDRALGKLSTGPARLTELIKLRGDASTRTYYRAHIEGADDGLPATLIVMQLPDDRFGSDEGGARPALERLPFLEVAELLGARGLPVPRIYAEDLDDGLILIEDLGDVTLERLLRESPRRRWPELYAKAVDLLARIHERCEDLPSDSIVRRRRFDRQLLDWELDHFRQWGLEALFGELDKESRILLDRLFESIASEVEAMPVGFVHRDYQSKNLMVAATGELTVIDFQDALVGPRVYDLVALLCDSYVALDLALQESMIERYAALRRIERARLRREFWVVALHRKLKDAGRFIFIDRVRKNPDFLRWYPQSLLYVARAIDQLSGFAALGELLRGQIPGYPGAISVPRSAME